MAKKEAYCTQCGSLIQVDDTKAQTKCLFCETDIDTKQALALNEDTEKREQLHKQVQEKATKEALEKKKAKSATESPKSITSPKKGLESKGTKQVIVIKPLPLKTKLIILTSFVLLVVVLSAIFIPLIVTRNAKRDSLGSSLRDGFTISIEDFSFRYNNNREIWIVTKDDVDNGNAIKTFEEYYTMYEDEYPSSASRTKKDMAVRIYAPSGLYLCAYQDGFVRCNFSTSDPSPTPGITATIGN